MLHEAVHALAHVCGVKDTSRGGKHHNKREFVALAGELGLAWPQGQRPHPVIGFSEVTLTEQTLTDYADTLAYLGAAIRLYRDTFRRLGLLGGQGGSEGQGEDGDGQEPTGKTGERFKVACGCQPPRSFWIRAKQYTPGPITCGVCGQDFQPQDTEPGHQQQGDSRPARPEGSSGGVEANPGLIGQGGDPFGPEHGRQLAKQAGQAPSRHDRHSVDDDLAPGDLGTVDGHDRRHGHPRVGQDLGGLVGLPRHRPQC